MAITVEIKSGFAIPHQVTVSDDSGRLQVSCTCQVGSGEEWCSHVMEVVCRDRVALTGTDQAAFQDAAIEVAERHLNIVVVMTKHLDSIKNDPARALQAQALEAAIADRLQKPPPDDPNKAAKAVVDRVAALTEDEEIPEADGDAPKGRG